jgi:alpha-L-fucosidase
MQVVAGWMRANGASIREAAPLPDGERASVPATAAGATRYLFALPRFKDNGMYEKDLLPPAGERLTLTGAARPVAVTLLRDGSPLEYEFAGGTLTIDLPASARTTLVDVVRVVLR